MRPIPLAAIVIVVVATAAHALHQESPGALRLTSGPAHQASGGRAWGNWVAFESTQDLAGVGATRVPGPQIFVFNLDYYDCAQGTTFPATPCPPFGTPYLVQATNGVGGPSNPSVSKPPSGSTDEFDVWIAFDALGTYGGNVGGAATRRQVFLKHLSTNEIVQVTTAADGDSVHPSLSSTAGVVVFESTAMLAGFPNPSGASQVYLYERGTNVVRQLSLTPGPAPVAGQGPSTNPMPNEGGGGVAFESSADLLGTGADTGVSQIFWVDYDKPTHTATLRQLTAGDGPSRNPFPGEGANVVVFDSTATDLPGAAGQPGRRLYEASVANPPATPLHALTSTALFGDCDSPALDPSGTRLAFVCTGDPLQNFTTGPRLFVLDETTTTLYQLTGLGAVAGRPAPNLGQWFVTVATSSDLTGAGSCVQQLHVIDYFPGHWAAATSLGQYPADALGNACGSVCTTSADCDDLNPCNGVETCGPDQLCAHGTPIVCSDGNACNGVETCNPANGSCSGGVPLACNDGNPCTDDTCAPASGCVFTANTVPCNDGNACTTGDACMGGTCTGTPLGCPTCERCDPGTGSCASGPRTTCAGPGGSVRSTLRLRKAPLAASDALVWKWRLAGSAADFGNPLLSDDYALCLYDGADALALRTDAPAGATCGATSCWRAKAAGSFLYRDPSGTPTGLAKLLLKTKAGAGTKVAVKGRGANLAMPSPASVSTPVRAQLQTSTGACWEAVYDAAAVRVQDASQLKAKIP
jgi:hypothetical protein